MAAFHTGLAAIQASAEHIAEAQLQRVVQLVPQEPAAWANLGLLALRRTAFDVAAKRLQKARMLAPDNSQIQALSGLLESMQGHLAAAQTYLQQAIALDGHNVKAMYALAQLIERQGGPDSLTAVQRLLTQILEVQPDNLAILLERVRVAAKQGDSRTLQNSMAPLQARATSWSAAGRGQLAALQTTVATADLARTAQNAMLLKNVLVREPAYRQSLAAVYTPFGQGGEAMPHFLWLATPEVTPAAPDGMLTFAPTPLPVSQGLWTWVNAVRQDDASPLSFILANGHAVQLVGSGQFPFPGGATASPPLPDSIAILDTNNDFKLDLALAGAGGFVLLQQDDTGAFTDVTAQMALPEAITHAAYVGVWPLDIDSEGDLDMVLATPTGAPLILRNNGDGTFTLQHPFDGVTALRAFAWGDLDADGDPDAVLLDARGTLQVYLNQRLGQFQTHPVPPAIGRVLAMVIADIHSDSWLDLVLLQADGQVQRLSLAAEDSTWQMATLTQWPQFPTDMAVASARLWVADLDNNGALDLLIALPMTGRVWLGDVQGKLQALPQPVLATITAIADVTDDGRLDLLGLSQTEQPLRLVNQGTRDYGWLALRPRAVPSPGDQRINAFALGGEVEVRAGLLFQKQPITGPLLHFGLGEHQTANVARIIWPNGDVQAVFDLQANQTVVAEQRLKGSCPWVFADNGQGVQFVTDFLWRSPLGLRINAQDTADVMMTEDRVKIRGDQLVPRDGLYEVRITAELWETHFVDHVALLVVDHPAETDIFVDERFAIPPPPLAVYPTAPPQPVAQAWDDRGQAVSDLLQARDGRYLDTFGRGAYQGVTRDHYVEIDFGSAVPSSGALWLIASGWIRPTDSSLNVAMSQGRQVQPQGLRLEVPDGQGGWRVARANLGFPAGKNKTVLLDLQGIWSPGSPRRLRLRTTMEIYWDAFAWAAGLPDTVLSTRRLRLHTADLHYRGFSVVHAANRSSPELPQYDTLAGTAPRWRDLIGYYTRFGDVRELLQAVDDRYVIMNAGDELRLRFMAPPAPPPGWQRDFVLIGDGWVKDGDYHTTFSKTVLPLPAHDQPAYQTPPGALEDDPVYRRHASDWQHYHTRYVTPQPFHTALRRP